MAPIGGSAEVNVQAHLLVELLHAPEASAMIHALAEPRSVEDLGARSDERDDLYRQMAQLGLQESVRVWLVTAMVTRRSSGSGSPGTGRLNTWVVGVIRGCSPVAGVLMFFSRLMSCSNT
jgi:hypothetical protein